MHPGCIHLVVLAGMSSLAFAGDSTFWLDSESSMTSEFAFSALATGSLIGDYDEKTNPDGTKTMPGVWGEEGNEPIPLDFSQELAGGGSTWPTGSFELNVDTSIGLIAVEELDVNVLGGDTRDELPIDSTIYLFFDTFRTYNPASLFVGGFEVPIPIGTGTVTAWQVEQVGIAGGVLQETGTPGEWTFSMVATVNILITAALEGQPIEFPPVTIELPLAGTYVETDTEQLITFNFDQSIDDSEILSPPIPLPDTPLPLPTILPPGDTANVILSLSLTEYASQVLQAGSLRASRDIEQPVPGDATGDGHVNVDDLLVIIAEWGPCPGCAGDLDSDDVVGVEDLLIVLANWGT